MIQDHDSEEGHHDLYIIKEFSTRKLSLSALKVEGCPLTVTATSSCRIVQVNCKSTALMSHRKNACADHEAARVQVEQE